MNLTLRMSASMLGMAGLALMAVTAVVPGAQAEETFKSFNISGRANVRVNTNDGNVRVSAGDSKQVEFRVDYQGYEVGKNLRIDTHQDGDKVELTARISGHWGFAWSGNSRRLRIEVRMPKDADLQVETGDGAVEASGINGTVAVHTADGAVKANMLNGNIDLHTNDGSITVDTLKGAIKLRSGDGSIEARDLDGTCEADSGDGHIRLAGRFDSLNIRTGDGSVNTRVLPGSKMAAGWNIRTGDGSVDLVLPGDFQADLDATTGDGHISVGMSVMVEGTLGNSSNSRIHGKLNGGGQALLIHTGDGSIRLSKS